MPGFTAQVPEPPFPVIAPVTLVAAVPLAEKRQKIEALWFAGNFSIARLGMSSLTAIIA
jgi:hypothetical protein